jgi:geranylgeranyl diphosphate synthase type I
VDDIKLAENKRIPTESEYIKMVEKKTAVLFEVACAMGAISAKKPAKDVKNLSVFGRNLGIAFQITDDLIGIMGDSKVTGKAVGNDIREGKKSLPILLAIRKARGSDKKKILRVFGKSKATRSELNAVVSIIRSLGIEEAVRKQALRYANRATKALDKYSGVHKSELIVSQQNLTNLSVQTCGHQNIYRVPLLHGLHNEVLVCGRSPQFPVSGLYLPPH